MSGWTAYFRARFFAAWQSAGFPPPEPVPSPRQPAARDARASAATELRSVHPLDPAIVADVAAFGRLFGSSCIELLGGVPPACSIEQRVAWCGEFNLGISLFDYLCDVAGDAHWVAALPALRGLGLRATDAVSLDTGSSALRALDDLVGRVLADLEAAPDRRHVATLRRTLRSMYAAELVAASAPSGARAVRDWRQVLQLKSVEPFRVMAEWATRAHGRSHDLQRRAMARRLGRAFGHCVWLIDDAQDLWQDLDSGQPNLFALLATGVARSSSRRDAAADARLASQLVRDHVAERLAASAVRRLAVAVQASGVGHARQERALTPLATALSRW